MKGKGIFITTAFVLALFACTPVTRVPDVSLSDVSREWVVLQARPGFVGSLGANHPTVLAEARRGCSLYRRRPVYLSTGCDLVSSSGVCAAMRYLFACRS